MTAPERDRTEDHHRGMVEIETEIGIEKEMIEDKVEEAIMVIVEEVVIKVTEEVVTKEKEVLVVTKVIGGIVEEGEGGIRGEGVLGEEDVEAEDINNGIGTNSQS